MLAVVETHNFELLWMAQASPGRVVSTLKAERNRKFLTTDPGKLIPRISEQGRERVALAALFC